MDQRVFEGDDKRAIAIFKGTRSLLERNGVPVFSSPDIDGTVLELGNLYKARYGREADFIEWVADVHGYPKDPSARADFRRGLEDRSVFNVIVPQKRRKVDLTKYFKFHPETANMAVKLKNFVREHWDLVAWVATAAARTVFDLYCANNPPQSPEEEQLRQQVRAAINVAGASLAAYGEYKTAKAFVLALIELAKGGGAAAALSAATAGAALLLTAFTWYAQWWVEAHTAYQLSARLGSRTVSFVIEKPKSLLQDPRLTFYVDGKKVASWNCYVEPES